MAMSASDRGKDTRQRLEKCWEVDVNWNLYPRHLKEVCFVIATYIVALSSTVVSGN